jgi:hypothetical protein
MRCIDVRDLVDATSEESRDCTIYIEAEQLYQDTTLPADRRGAYNALFGRLTTGSGGISVDEEFIIPALGKDIHIGADSVRLEVWYDPARAGYSETVVPGINVKACAGFRVKAHVTTALLLQDYVRREWYEGDGGVGAAINIPIPQFTRLMMFSYEAPTNVQITWLDVFQNVISQNITPTEYHGRFGPIPVDAAFIRLTVTAAAGVNPILTTRPMVTWSRHS